MNAPLSETRHSVGSNAGFFLGVPAVDDGSAVLAAFQADADEIAFPPFAPGFRWAIVVSRNRGRTVVLYREIGRSELDLSATCSYLSTDVTDWARAVDSAGTGGIPIPFPWGALTAGNDINQVGSTPRASAAISDEYTVRSLFTVIRPELLCRQARCICSRTSQHFQR